MSIHAKTASVSDALRQEAPTSHFGKSFLLYLGDIISKGPCFVGRKVGGWEDVLGQSASGFIRTPVAHSLPDIRFGFE